MTFTNYGAQASIWNIGSTGSPYKIEAIEVGYGSGTVAITNVQLINGSIRVMQTGSPNFTSARKVTFQGDFSSIQMSGLQLSEIGLFASGTLNIGSSWLREYFSPITFDGTNELQVLSTIEAIPG